MVTTPAWLTSLIDQRLALLEHAIGSLEFKHDAVFTLLTENPLVPPHINERTCDNPGCRKYCGDDDPFYTGVIERTLRNGKPVIMGYGVCGDCKRQLD